MIKAMEEPLEFRGAWFQYCFDYDIRNSAYLCMSCDVMTDIRTGICPLCGKRSPCAMEY